MGINVGILVVADSIPQEIKDRFVNCIDWSEPKADYEIIMMENEREEGVPFNKCILLNDGLKNAFKRKFDVIIQTDIDLLVPPGAIDFTCEQAMGGNFCVHLPMIRLPKEVYENSNLKYKDYPWQEWVNMGQKQYATGCWNGLTPKAWSMTGGFNPHMTGWGFEDRDWRGRGLRNGVKWKDNWKWYKRFPLIHVNHPDRNPNKSKENKQVANKKVKSYL
jgi:hypothetical protein